jgi:hypothetical protein
MCEKITELLVYTSCTISWANKKHLWVCKALIPCVHWKLVVVKSTNCSQPSYAVLVEHRCSPGRSLLVSLVSHTVFDRYLPLMS